MAGSPAGRRRQAAKAVRPVGAAGKRSGGRPDPQARDAAAAEVIATAIAMSRLGLSPGRSGNVSCRWGDGMLITPTGLAYETLAVADIVEVAGDGRVAAGERKPSSEWRFHLAAYAVRPVIGAVVHAHSLHAVALACARRPIPAFHYMVAVAGGSDIPCVPYATFGTEELSRYVADGLANRNACLMANHGQIAVGTSLKAALDLAAEVETLAAQYCLTLAIGGPALLGADEMSVVVERFKTYGQQPRS
jgi:L-fuculose-phosphate aldolase